MYTYILVKILSPPPRFVPRTRVIIGQDARLRPKYQPDCTRVINIISCTYYARTGRRYSYCFRLWVIDFSPVCHGL